MRRHPLFAAGTPRRRHRRTGGGFTLVEVLISLLIAMIGLMGTVAIQQTVLTATKNANDAQIAMRLATQALEELNARVTIQNGALPIDRLQPIADAAWRGPNYLDERAVISMIATPSNRFARRFQVTNRGPSLPYNIIVEVRYALDSGNPKLVRLDSERRKSW